MGDTKHRKTANAALMSDLFAKISRTLPKNLAAKSYLYLQIYSKMSVELKMNFFCTIKANFEQCTVTLISTRQQAVF